MSKHLDPYQKFVLEHKDQADRVQALVDRGRAHLERGAKEEARRDFQRALLVFPHVPAALNNLALLAFAEGDSERGRAYLEDLLMFDPAEPTGNALLAKYWTDEAAAPVATKYAIAAVDSVLLLSKADPSSDPTRVRRSLEFVYQALAGLGADADILRLHFSLEAGDLFPTTKTHIGVALFNRGYFAEADAMWRQAVEEGYALAETYLDMQAILAEKQLKPFRLDHLLEVPSPPEKEDQVWLTHVPSLFLAAATTRVYRDEATSAEEALSFLAGTGVACVAKILVDVASDITRPVRLRLLAILHMIAAGELAPAATLANAIERRQADGESEVLWCLVRGLLAEAADDTVGAGDLALQGLAVLENLDEINIDDKKVYEPLRAMLKGLARRTGAEGKSTSLPDSVVEGDEELQLPDAEWLRQNLRSILTVSLEEVLAKRSSDAVEELGGRLGETNFSQMPQSALLRRVAVRMRSLQLERVLRMLPTGSRELLKWLDDQEFPVDLPHVFNYLSQTLPTALPWEILEALYRTCVVDIGLLEPIPEGVPPKAAQLAVAIPTDLQGRFQR